MGRLYRKDDFLSIIMKNEEESARQRRAEGHFAQRKE